MVVVDIYGDRGDNPRCEKIKHTWWRTVEDPLSRPFGESFGAVLPSGESTGNGDQDLFLRASILPHLRQT